MQQRRQGVSDRRSGSLVRPLARRRGGPGLAEQIAARIEFEILSGDLRCGSRLPSHRDLARTLRVDRRTVGQAYRRLGRLGLVAMEERRGAVVRPPTGRGSDEIADLTPPDALFEAAAKALHAGFSGPQLTDAVEAWSTAVRNRRLSLACEEPELADLVRLELTAAIPGLAFVSAPAGLPAIVVHSSAQETPTPDTTSDFLASLSPIPIRLSLGRTIHTAIGALEEGQIVAAISQSSSAANLVRRAAVTLAGRTLGFVSADSRNQEKMKRAVALSHLVLVDPYESSSVPAGIRGPCLPLRLVAPVSTGAIGARLGVRLKLRQGVRIESCSVSGQRL